MAAGAHATDKPHPPGLGRRLVLPLLLAWSGLPLVVSVAALDAFAGFLLGIFFAALVALGVPVGFAAPTTALVSVASGFAIGAVVLVSYYASWAHLLGVLISCAVGAVIALVAVPVIGANEIRLLKLRGYREPSWRERERLDPLMAAVGAGDIHYLMADVFELRSSGAWAHPHTLVIATGLLRDFHDDENLTGILAHEVGHIRRGHTKTLLYIWTAAWPLTLTYDILRRVSGGQPKEERGFAAVIYSVLWLFLWGNALVMRFLLIPSVRALGRRQEFEADEFAETSGFGPALFEALTLERDYEPPRTGWEFALSATHPPLELRLARLDPARPQAPAATPPQIANVPPPVQPQVRPAGPPPIGNSPPPMPPPPPTRR
jgi:Zn-dependent protease with chaperone function